MEIKYNYNCSKNEAYGKIDNLLDELQQEHADKISDASKSWNSNKDYMDFNFKAMGFNIKGMLNLKQTS